MISSNQQNNGVKVFADVYNENILIDSMQLMQYIALSEDHINEARILQDSEQDDSNNSSNIVNNNIKTDTNFLTPVIRKFKKSTDGCVVSLGRPSLSQRTLKLSYYKYLYPDDEDEICSTVVISVKEAILVNKTACTTFIRAKTGNINLTIIRNDIFLETLRGNLTFEITPDFEVNGMLKYFSITFDEPITIPDELNVWVNNDMVFKMIYDKVIISSLPDLPANKPFIIDLTEYINPISSSNKTGVIQIGLLYENGSCLIAQKEFSIDPTQNFYSISEFVFISDINPSSFNTYQRISGLNISFSTYFYQPLFNDTFHVMLPNDFPPNYFIDEEEVKCTIIFMDFYQVFLVNVTNKCQMKGTFIDINIIETNLTAVNNVFSLNIHIIIDNIFSSPNYGNSGDISLLIYSWVNENKIVKCANFRGIDWYVNPVITQTLNIIKKNEGLSIETDQSLINMKKGSIKPIFLRPKDNKVNRL